MTKLLCPVIVFIKIIILYVYFAFNRPMFEKSIKASLGMMEAKCIGLSIKVSTLYIIHVYLNLPLIKGSINNLVPYNRQV